MVKHNFFHSNATIPSLGPYNIDFSNFKGLWVRPTMRWKSSSYQFETRDILLIYSRLLFIFSVYNKSLCQIMEVMSAPLIQSLQDRLERNKIRMEALQTEKQELLQKLKDTWTMIFREWMFYGLWEEWYDSKMRKLSVFQCAMSSSSVVALEHFVLLQCRYRHRICVVKKLVFFLVNEKKKTNTFTCECSFCMGHAVFKFSH